MGFRVSGVGCSCFLSLSLSVSKLRVQGLQRKPNGYATKNKKVSKALDLGFA